MDILSNLVSGFSHALSPIPLLYCFFGVTLGTLVGVLPGIGAMAAISILLPLCYSIGDPVVAMIFLAGVYYGTQYGGSTTAILLKMPGEPSSAVTTIDGYQMTLAKRGGAALTIAAVSSFVAGTIATLIISLLAQPLAQASFLFGSTEYTMIMVIGLLASISLTQGSLVKGTIMVGLGIWLGMIGLDPNTGATRYTFGILELSDGINFGILAMGIFGLAELVWGFRNNAAVDYQPKFKDLYPTAQEAQEATIPALRGTAIGSLLGLLPGGGTVLSSFISYSVEKYWSRTPEKFGQGAVAGVAGPEAANNASAQTGFIPMLSLGIPTTPIMALIIAALIAYGIQPGPKVISSNPDLFWSLIASMWIGNLMLLILNLPLVGIWVQVLRIPKNILVISTVLVCVVGAYSFNNDWFDVLLLLPITVLGLAFKKWGFEPAPLAMGFVVGPMLEEYLTRSLAISHGNWAIFIDRPVSLILVLISISIIAVTQLPKLRQRVGTSRGT